MIRTFCITLPETPERTAAARAHFAERGVPVEFIYGVHAKTFGIFTTHVYEIDHPGSGYMIPQKHVGLCLSHYLAWSLCSLIEGDRFLILEDDAEFAPDWQSRFEQALADAPTETDLLLIGSGNTYNKPKEQVKGELFSVKWPQCTHATVIYRKVLPLLLETQRDIWAPIDLALIFRSYPKLNVYTVLPRICAQRGIEIAP